MASLFKLGLRGYHATVKEFQGKIRVHIRKYIDIEERKNIPTKFGIALSIEEFEELKKVLDDLTEMLDVMIDTCSMTTQPGDDEELLSAMENEQPNLPRNQSTPKNCKRPEEINEPPKKKLFTNAISCFRTGGKLKSSFRN